MNRPATTQFCAWPGWPHIRFASLRTVLVTAWFCCVFGGTDWITAHRIARVRVHLDAELHIPLIPAFTVVYMSIYLLFLAAPFILRTRKDFNSLSIAQTLAISFAGICFLLIPAQLAFPPATNPQLGIWKPLFRFADWLNLDYNLVPSLHVTLSIICIEMFASHASILGKTLLRLWGSLIAASTVLTHQHYVLDVVTGYLLAIAVIKLVCRLDQHHIFQRSVESLSGERSTNRPKDFPFHAPSAGLNRRLLTLPQSHQNSPLSPGERAGVRGSVNSKQQISGTNYPAPP